MPPKAKRLLAKPKKLAAKRSVPIEEIFQLALGSARSRSAAEDERWTARLDAALMPFFKRGEDKLIDAVEACLEIDEQAYIVLMDRCQTLAENQIIEHEGQRYYTQLIGVPVLASSVYSIGQGKMPVNLHNEIVQLLQKLVLAPIAKLDCPNFLYTAETLPGSLATIRQWTHHHGKAALTGHAYTADAGKIEPSNNLVADVRYLLAVAVVPEGQPVFAWEQTGLDVPSMEQVEKIWHQSAMPIFRQALPGCMVECILPSGHGVAMRDADVNIRPVALRGGVNYIKQIAEVEEKDVLATLAAVGNEDEDQTHIHELRIGLTPRGGSGVYYGVDWPIFDDDDLDINATEVAFEQIQALLRECGVIDISISHGLFDAEYCEDCGVPFYPEKNGGLVHPEIPDDLAEKPTHFH